VSPADSSAALGYEPSNGGGEPRIWVEAGGRRRVGALTDAQKRRLVSAVLDVRPEPHARLVLLGMDVEGLRPAARAALRDRIAFLPADGGLISSLNAWENIVLPTGFHRPRRLRGVVGQVAEMLRGLGADPSELLGKLPERMTPYERKLTGYVRIALEKPDLLLEEAQAGADPAEKLPAAYLASCPGGTFVQLETAP
jgi:ABC-type transporter Mla maintaining outer membrane lipid asymmetry ATPase subunit MlaF